MPSELIDPILNTEAEEVKKGEQQCENINDTIDIGGGKDSVNSSEVKVP